MPICFEDVMQGNLLLLETAICGQNQRHAAQALVTL